MYPALVKNIYFYDMFLECGDGRLYTKWVAGKSGAFWTLCTNKHLLVMIENSAEFTALKLKLGQCGSPEANCDAL